MEQVKAFARELRVPEPMAGLLLGRGIVNRQQAEAFFSASLEDLPSPFLMEGMEEAVGVVFKALERNAPVLVYGDYDVDGTTGTALLLLFLRRIGFSEVAACQPHRLKDGYGLHPMVVRRSAPGYGGRKPLLITVDCGISCADQVRELRREGWEVVVTDHHLPPSQLPDADAVLDPQQPGCRYPEKHLAGVGVAFHLAMAVRSRLRERRGLRDGGPNLKEFLDLVAMGTVADLVPLTGVNRILVRTGLEVLAQAPRPGLRELIRLSGIKGRVAGDDIAYRLAPRLNAAGRLGDADRALRLLVVEDAEEAARLAVELDEENKRRKQLVSDIEAQVEAAAEQAVAAGRKGLVLSGDQWHPGVIGIAAARVADRFRRPTLLFSLQDGRARGSGRAAVGVDIHEILNELIHLFIEFGGHKAAVGVTMDEALLPRLEHEFNQRVAAAMTEEMLEPRLDVDWVDRDGQVFSKDFLELYQRMAPFGRGNPEPVLSVQGYLDEARIVGGRHLKFSMRTAGSRCDGIGFGLGDVLDGTPLVQPVEAAFRLRLNTYGKRDTWQMEALAFSR